MTRIRARQVLIGEQLVPAVITVKDGRIAKVEQGLEVQARDVDVVVEDDKILLPGLIDAHVHLNQPGRTDWEGFHTGTLAAISGGVTTVIDMPLNSIPPTTTVDNLEAKRQEALDLHCDVGFWGGIVPGNAGDLRAMLDKGVKGFKCFLCESGVDEFPKVEESDLHLACAALEHTSALVLFHAELGQHPHDPSAPSSSYSTFLSSRPASLELSALELILKLCRAYPSIRFHIVHLSAAEAVPLIREAREGGVDNLTVETCFHYLTLCAEDIPDDAVQFKCCPPIRDEANRQALIKAVEEGVIDYVVSDHSPCIPELKKGGFVDGWGGISGLGYGLPLMWTHLGQLGLPKIVQLLSGRQAKQVGLEGRKGEIVQGADADFVVFDPEERYTLQQDDLLFKNKISPYVGKEMRGRVLETWLRGEKVWSRNGEVLQHGQCL